MLNNLQEGSTVTFESISDSVGSTLLSFLSVNDLKVVRQLNKVSYSLVNEKANVTWKICGKNLLRDDDDDEEKTERVLNTLRNTFGKSKLSKFAIDLPRTTTQRNLDQLMILKNVTKVNLRGNENIHNVSVLGNVHTLNLSCTNVTDISALGNVHTLNLSHTAVTDVSALGNVHTLNIRGTHIADMSALMKVHTLHLSSQFRQE